MLTGLQVSWDISLSDFSPWVDCGTSVFLFFWDQQTLWGMACAWNMPNNIPVAKESHMTEHNINGSGRDIIFSRNLGKRWKITK